MFSPGPSRAGPEAGQKLQTDTEHNSGENGGERMLKRHEPQNPDFALASQMPIVKAGESPAPGLGLLRRG